MTQRPPILPPALGLLMMLVIFTLHFIKPIAVLLHYPMNYIGLVPIIVGVALHIMAERELRVKGVLNFNGEVNPTVVTLVTSGVYQFTRNPSHLGDLFIASGLALWVGSLSPWIVVVLSPYVLNSLFIKREEEDLRKRFGHRYEQYCESVPRWAGRPKCKFKNHGLK